MAAGVDFSDYFWVRRTSVKFASVFLTQDTYLHMNLFTHEVFKRVRFKSYFNFTFSSAQFHIFARQIACRNGFGSGSLEKIPFVKILKVEIHTYYSATYLLHN